MRPYTLSLLRLSLVPLATALFAGPLSGADVAVGDACVACHPSETAAYRETGMGRSISRVPAQPAGSFRHDLSDSGFAIEVRGAEMRQQVERRGLSATHPVDYVIGSGNAAAGYLVSVGNHLFQSPVSYYTESGRWDVAPGYETNPHPDFDRPVTAECLWCHAGRPLAVPFTLNRYEDKVFEQEAISCERCHGSPERHLAKPEASTIVNPSKLAPTQRDSVCEQCHLSGEARILNPGRSFGDFQPGMRLEEIFSVYLYERPADAGAFKVVSHVEQLASSQCAQLSGEELWCGTCHNPHEPLNQASQYRSKCESCHDAVSLTGHPEPLGGCIECHMPRKQSYDSGHSAFTDHRIARRPAADVDQEEARTLRAWRDPDGRWPNAIWVWLTLASRNSTGPTIKATKRCGISPRQ